MRGRRLKPHPFYSTLASCRTFDFGVNVARSPQLGLKGSTSKGALPSPRAQFKTRIQNKLNLGIKSFKELNQLIDVVPASPVKAIEKRLNSSRAVRYSSTNRRVATNSPVSSRQSITPRWEKFSRTPKKARNLGDREMISASLFRHRSSVDQCLVINPQRL
mmetsp:Transcript_29387/g.52606  ORF Transcript_29387/g.52606 Transcript_29387/m.52606 type:complete len:161 (+) Transcript_29387:26-508(+)